MGLLQLSAVELALKVQEALEGNVLLERGDEEEQEQEQPPVQAAEDAPESHEAPPAETSVDWDSSVSLGASDWDDEDGERPEAPERTGQSLKEYLLWQLELARLSARDAAIGAAIIDSLNDDGYLTESLEDIRGALADSDASPEPDEMDAMLHRVQSFEPPGIAARDLKECLLLQLRQDSAPDPTRRLATTLVNGHLEALATRDYAALCRMPGRGTRPAGCGRGHDLGLHPRPGTAIAGAPVDYVIPDVLVTAARAAAWRVELNPEAVPRVRINARYAAALRRSDTGGDMARQLQEARWLVRSIRMRNETLLRVARSIVPGKARSWSAARKPCSPCS